MTPCDVGEVDESGGAVNDTDGNIFHVRHRRVDDVVLVDQQAQGVDAVATIDRVPHLHGADVVPAVVVPDKAAEDVVIGGAVEDDPDPW